MKKEIKWNKWPIGKYEGHTLFIELSSEMNGTAHNWELAKAEGFIERAFKHDEFIDAIKDVLHIRD